MDENEGGTTNFGYYFPFRSPAWWHNLQTKLRIFKDAAATIDDADGLADFIRSIDGVEISFCITSLNATKVSLRSRGKYTVNDIAQVFGGGGHYYASGAEIQESEIDQTIEKILSKLKEKINNGN